MGEFRPRRWWHEMLGFGDLSLNGQGGRQWGLFGGVQLLGTRGTTSGTCATS